MIALIVAPALCGAAAITVDGPFLQLYNVGINSDGFSPGEKIRFGATSVVPNGAAGTIGYATTTDLASGAAVTRTIYFDPGPDIPNFFTRNITYSSTLTGPWTINFAAPGYTGYNTTLLLPTGATEVPFVNSITLTGTSSNPTFNWTPPPGTTVDGYRINIFDKTLINTDPSRGPLNSGQVVSANLAPGVTSYTVTAGAFTVPGYALTTGRNYSIDISVLQTRDGRSTDLGNHNVYAISRAYADFTPIAGSGGPAVNLPVALVDGSFEYDIAVTAGKTYYIDPAIATGYVYATGAGDPRFASVMLPGVQADPFEISFLEGSDWMTDSLLAGVVFDFPDGGVDQFTVTGIDAADGIDASSPTAFVTALTFAGSGTFTGTQTPLVASTVPEPAVSWLWIVGALGFATARRRRSIHGPGGSAGQAHRSGP